MWLFEADGFATISLDILDPKIGEAPLAQGRLDLGLMLRFGEHYSRIGNPIHWPELRRLAKLAEDVGFDTLWCDDHFVYDTFPNDGNPHGAVRGMWEGFTLLSAVAEATSRVTLGPFVACTSYRNPAHLAKIADTLDDISDGRVILGLGAGWNQVEYATYGYPFDHLATRFEEALQIIVPLLRDGHVDFQGTYYQARNCELRPRGPRANGPPIWIGASKPRMLGLAASYADAYNTVWHTTPEAMAERFRAFDAACRERGRDPATVRHTSGSYVALPGSDGAVPIQFRPAIRASPDEVAEQLHAFQLAGAEHFTVSVEPWDSTGLERCGKMIESLRKLEGRDAC
ncbi:MAG TPA: LLM class flavin-dependent oxidoreductase [Chloroflexota bacterium]|nr:LLM class flavin-dependent oxidoreductase [Chloroflexota bacterium]